MMRDEALDRENDSRRAQATWIQRGRVAALAV